MTIDSVALVEAILMAADEPLSLEEIHAVLAEDGFTKSDILDALKALRVMLEEDKGGVELVEVASGWRLQVPARFAKWVGKLYEEKQNRYSTALFETIALIAYQQPVTRGDIEAVRGVSVSSNIIKTLEEREWIKVIGRKETPGRPMLYATTEQFLDDFNLKSIEELPLLPELEALLNDSEDKEQSAGNGKREREVEVSSGAVDTFSQAEIALESNVPEKPKRRQTASKRTPRQRGAVTKEQNSSKATQPASKRTKHSAKEVEKVE